MPTASNPNAYEPECPFCVAGASKSTVNVVRFAECVWDCPGCGRVMRQMRPEDIAGELTPCRRCIEAAVKEARARKALGLKGDHPNARKAE